MPGIDGRYMVMPSGLTAATAMSSAVEGLGEGFSAVSAVRVMILQRSEGGGSPPIGRPYQADCANPGHERLPHVALTRFVPA
jgi:hypothetical protein